MTKKITYEYNKQEIGAAVRNAERAGDNAIKCIVDTFGEYNIESISITVAAAPKPKPPPQPELPF